MPIPRINASAFEDLGTWLQPPPLPPPMPEARKTWRPNMTPAQQRLWDSVVKNILAWSEKGSGKTWGVLLKLVRHCYDNNNALSVIIVREKSMANKGGAWDKLINHVLPTWRDGNRDKEGQLMDAGLGLHFSDVKFDENHNPMVFVQNRHGGWSKVVLVSAPHAEQLRKRIRGYEISFAFVDELTSCDSHVYHQSVAAQIGRVKGIPLQQYVAACNPEGESHWVFQKWFVQAFDEKLKDWNPEYEQIHFPAEENVGNMQAGYFESLVDIYKDDPIEAARMIDGLWKERIAGDGLFSEVFNPLLHVRPIKEDGSPDEKSWLMAHPDYPIIMGVDPGAVYNVWGMCQRLPIDNRMKWAFFDEVATFKQKISYTKLVPIVMRKLRFWRDLADKEIPFVCISDDNAFNVFRPGGGENIYDVLAIQRVWEEHRREYRLEPLKIRACPKFQGSVRARITILQTALGMDEVVVSSRCKHIRAMLSQLRSEPQKEGAPFDPSKAMTPMRCDHLHVFDGVTYPMLAASTQPSLLIPLRSDAQTLISAA